MGGISRGKMLLNPEGDQDFARTDARVSQILSVWILSCVRLALGAGIVAVLGYFKAVVSIFLS